MEIRKILDLLYSSEASQTLQITQNYFFNQIEINSERKRDITEPLYVKSPETTIYRTGRFSSTNTA